jgi:hypothetical protein
MVLPCVCDVESAVVAFMPVERLCPLNANA